MVFSISATVPVHPVMNPLPDIWPMYANTVDGEWTPNCVFADVIISSHMRRTDFTTSLFPKVIPPVSPAVICFPTSVNTSCDNPSSAANSVSSVTSVIASTTSSFPPSIPSASFFAYSPPADRYPSLLSAAAARAFFPTVSLITSGNLSSSSLLRSTNSFIWSTSACTIPGAPASTAACIAWYLSVKSCN